jgi:hypothetical protein
MSELKPLFEKWWRTQLANFDDTKPKVTQMAKELAEVGFEAGWNTRKPDEAKICRIRTDNDGHNYLIPNESVEMFEKSLSEISQYTESTDGWYDAIADFEEDFRQYRIDGIEDLDILCKQSGGSEQS